MQANSDTTEQCSVRNCFNMIRYWYLWNVIPILTTKTLPKTTSMKNNFDDKKRLAANMFGNKQLWRQTVLTTDIFDDRQFWRQTILVTNNHHLSLLDSSSKCLLSFISLFNNGETVFICFGNAFTVNRFFSQAYVQRHPFQREDYKCSLHGLRFGFSRTSVIKNKTE